MPEERKEATACEVIKYLSELKENLVVYGEEPEVMWECEFDDETNQITAITYEYYGDGPTCSAKYESYSISILGYDFYTDSFMYYEDAGAECWEVDDIDIGDPSIISDILDKHDCEKDDDGTYSEEDIRRILQELLYDKVSCCSCDEISMTVDNILDAIGSDPLYILKSEEDNPKRVFTYNDIAPEGEEYNEDGEDKSEEEINALFVEIDAERAAKILYDNDIECKENSWV